MGGPRAATDARFDHVVVVMFENRSFDNLLGFLYRPGEVREFEGVGGRALANPVPAEFPDTRPRTIPVHAATNMDTPDPDPGEEYPHINTQLFGTVAPPGNASLPPDDMLSPYNAPASSTPVPTMDGFVTDYYHTFRYEMGRSPSYDELAQIMAAYTPEQLPVVSALARGFACFDHWFCEVPSQTYPNRSFFHAASSSGFVLNGPPGKFATGNGAETIFERLSKAGRTWKVYVDPEQLLPATGLIHASRLAPFFGTHFSTVFDFYEEARLGRLPDYAFLEPNMLHPHADMHPPGAARLRHDLGLPPPASMAGGEQLLARVYEAVRTSSTSTGSNWSNTLMLVTFDEHGGIFDHVPPPPAPPPGDGRPPEQGFAFDRSGVRIPTLAVSAWIDPQTVVTPVFRSTSVIRTLRERWSLGPPLTNRDAAAPDIAPILTRAEPRPPAEWPRVVAKPLGFGAKVVDFFERPLARLERDLVGEAMMHESRVTGRAIDEVRTLRTRGDAHRHGTRIRDQFFPGVAGGRKR
jgi:phospholipase C